MNSGITIDYNSNAIYKPDHNIVNIAYEKNIPTK